MKSFKQVLVFLCLMAAMFGCVTTRPIVEATKETVKAEASEEGVVVLVVFGAAWCPYCQAFDKEIPRLQEKYGSQVKFIKVDTDKTPAKEILGIDVPGIPFFVTAVNGQVIRMGNADAKEIEDSLDEDVKLLDAPK